MYFIHFYGCNVILIRGILSSRINFYVFCPRSSQIFVYIFCIFIVLRVRFKKLIMGSMYIGRYISWWTLLWHDWVRSWLCGGSLHNREVCSLRSFARSKNIAAVVYMQKSGQGVYFLFSSPLWEWPLRKTTKNMLQLFFFFKPITQSHGFHPLLGPIYWHS